jgi:16S rRNA (adenine1518-N6/adenine1519-N6)-dimethyltransferase
MFHLPRKRFAQHFLRDPQVIQRIIAAIAPLPNQHLVEIGAGQGALTIPLLHCGCRLDVIELDRDLVAQLQATIKPLSIYLADALQFDFKQLVQDQPLRIVGNLPYNISTPLLFHLLKYAPHLQDLTLMLQKEVVDRLVAKPATSAYGRLSVILQYHCQVNPCFDVAPQAFFPPPQVDSSVIQLQPHRTPPVIILNWERFNQVVTQAFSQKRKILRNTLKGLLTEEAIQAVDIDPHTRAETLSLEEFAKLANIPHHH